MRNFWWICWIVWESLPTLAAHPVSFPRLSDDSSEALSSWPLHWERYTVGLLGVTVTALTLVGCLCCRRPRRPKGFQEFKDGSTIGHDSSVGNNLGGLELELSRTARPADRVHFEPLPVDRIVQDAKPPLKPKPPPLPSSIKEEYDPDRFTLQEPCCEWFGATDRQVPRENLKYLREIGRGWFGKVVEGRTDFEGARASSRSDGVVVRILTEEASIREKAWFLGEATPYLKLQHRNVLALLGFCLETDPYLLLFESCPPGDLKGFLRSNRDALSREALAKEHVPTRMAVEIAAGLRHMHAHGFAHTDLAARNCLVASDLSAKLGDYGTGVDKYPGDYYTVGDRALPIRWSAPESLACTETTIETREITSSANLWSYAVLLWEIATWGERPYDALGDEQVIEMAFKSGSEQAGSELLLRSLSGCPSTVRRAMTLCWHLNPAKRPALDEVQRVLADDQAAVEDFERRWENLRPNASNYTRSASLQDLRGSVDSDYRPNVEDGKAPATPKASFRLGPGELVKNIPGSKAGASLQESGSETEEESWRGRVERGAYTEKVRQKSKSVADLMVLVHIDSDSDAEWSMGGPSSEKSVKKRISATGSDGDLRSAVLADEFDEALRKLRDPLQSGSVIRGVRVPDGCIERPKLLTLTTDQERMPILRLSFGPEIEERDADCDGFGPSKGVGRPEEHVLRLLPKGDPELPVLRYVPESESSRRSSAEAVESPIAKASVTETSVEEEVPRVSDGFNDDNPTIDAGDPIDVVRWNHALDSVLDNKVPGFSGDSSAFPEDAEEMTPELVVTTTSAPDTPKSRDDYSVGNAEDDFSIAEELDAEAKRLSTEADEEEYHKRLSTPDDERSSDSGFRDKESCEEEESPPPLPPPPPPPPLPSLASSSPIRVIPFSISESISAEEEQLRVLSELDAILDAEYYESPTETEGLALGLPEADRARGEDENGEEGIRSSKERSASPESSHLNNNDSNLAEEMKNCSESNSTLKGEEEKPSEDQNREETKDISSRIEERDLIGNDSYSKIDTSAARRQLSPRDEEGSDVSVDLKRTTRQADGEDASVARSLEDIRYDENDDEDSSTVSLQSDNSYISFGIEEEFVTAIRNELKEKLPQAQMSVVEVPEPRDDVESSVIEDAAGSKGWDDEDSEDSSASGSGVVDISIRYNVYGTPLSPILEERESAATSESLMSRDDSRDVSLASKESIPSEDVLLVDTKTNRAVLLEGVGGQQASARDDERDTSNGDTSDEENLDYNMANSSLARISLERNQPRLISGSGGAPLPSPEDEPKWQQLPPPFPLPLPSQDDLMSTSFTTDRDWDSQDDGEEEEEDDDDEDEDEEDEEGNSSSSGEFVWKRYDESDADKIASDRATDRLPEAENEADLEEEAEDEDEEEEFTPSAWDATLAPHRSALRSPDKIQKAGDQKKSVWFKKQRYHCVYEYPKEILPIDNQGQSATVWEPTSYSDWEEMMDERKLDLYPVSYDETDHAGDEEFYISSSNRPFQFQSGDGKYVSQFFPGATPPPLQPNLTVEEEQQEQTDRCQQSRNDRRHLPDQQQLGELRHTRDRLKLNLLSSNGTATALTAVAKQAADSEEKQPDPAKSEDPPEAPEITLPRNQKASSPERDANPTTEKEPRPANSGEDNLAPPFTETHPSDNQKNLEPEETAGILAQD